MTLFWLRVLETEDGKTYTRYMIVGAYKQTQAREKVKHYYEVALRGMGITYKIISAYRVSFDIGDIALLSGRMLP